MKHKVSELDGALLDAAVAKAMGYSSIRLVPDGLCGTWYAGESDGGVNDWFPSKSWEQAGPIIERELIEVRHAGIHDVNGGSLLVDGKIDMTAGWIAYTTDDHYELGQTPLIAAMRAFVHSKFGDEVAIP